METIKEDIEKDKLSKVAKAVGTAKDMAGVEYLADQNGINHTQLPSLLSREFTRGDMLGLSDEQLKKLVQFFPSLKSVVRHKKPSLNLDALTESDPSLKPRLKWHAGMTKEIKASNPDYSDEQVSNTIGNIWYHDLSTEKRKEIRGREGKHLGKAEGMEENAGDKFVDQYLETALWSSTEGDDAGTPLDDNYDIEDLSAEVIAKAKRDCHEFIKKAGSLLDGLDMTQVAHDFWLTRNHHGAGFFDGDYEDDIGKKLTDLADEFGEVNLYIGDDGKIYEDKERGIAMVEGVDSSSLYDISKMKKYVADVTQEIKANPDMYMEPGSHTTSYMLDEIASDRQGIHQVDTVVEFFGPKNIGYKQLDDGQWFHESEKEHKFDKISDDPFAWESIEVYAEEVAQDLSHKVGATLGFGHHEGNYGLFLYLDEDDLKESMTESFSNEEYKEADKLLGIFLKEKEVDDAVAKVTGELPEVSVGDVSFLFGNRELIAYTPDRVFIWDINNLGSGDKFVLFDIYGMDESLDESMSGEMEVSAVIPLKNTIELKGSGGPKYLKLPVDKKASDFKVGQKIKIKDGKIEEELKEAKFELSVIKLPSGKFGFVGSVPKDLVIRKADGSALSDEEFNEYKNASNPSMIKKLNKYVEPIFGSEEEAIEFAEKNGHKIVKKEVAEAQLTESTEPRVYVGTYGKYAGGSIDGKWLNLDDYKSKKEFLKAAHELHKDESDPELMFQDYEGFPESYYSESDINEKLWDWLDLSEDEREILEAYVEVSGEKDATIKDAQEHFMGKFKSKQYWAAEFLEETGGLDPKNAHYYLEISDTDRRIIAGEEADAYIENQDDDDILKEADLEDEYEQADEAKKEDILRDAKEKVQSEMADVIEEKLKDPAEYFVDELGSYSIEDLMKANFISVDYEKFAREAEISGDVNFVEKDGDVLVFSSH